MRLRELEAFPPISPKIPKEITKLTCDVSKKTEQRKPQELPPRLDNRMLESILEG
jgi:hypothetical protein